MSAKEENTPVLSQCVNPDGISWRALWYYPTSAPLFLICSHCYNQHIASTPHAGLFEASWKDGYLPRLCQWNTPQILSHLAANNWDSIKSFMVLRTNIPACKGLAGHAGADRSLWYRLTGAWEIKHFVMCEACYHDLVIWNHLKEYFTTKPEVKPDEGEWVCDAALPLVKDGLQRAITSPDRWDEVHLLCTRRMDYPSCEEMKDLQSGCTHWYNSKSVPDLIICTACYLDHFVLDHADSWQLLSLTPEQQQGQQFQCAMRIIQINSVWTACKQISIANNTYEYHAFEELSRMILESPPCGTQGTGHTAWYTLKDYHGDKFAICKRCFLGFMVTRGFSKKFKEVSFPQNTGRICDLNPSKPRSLKYFDKYEVAVNQKIFSIFSDFVSGYAGLLDCPRNQAWKSWRWYGKGSFTACEICFKDVIEGTSLANQLDYKVIPNEARCHMYSPRMRSLWHAACNSNDLASFLALADERNDVYLSMCLEKQRVESAQLQRMMQWHMLSMASINNRHAESIASIFASGDTMYGNSTMGFNWHSEAGVQAEQQFQQALGINIVQPGDNMALMSLLQRWAALE